MEAGPLAPAQSDSLPPGTIRAAFELDPVDVDTLLRRASGPADDPTGGRFVAEHDGRVTVDFPAVNWGRSAALLLSAIVAGEAMELAVFSRCRLVDLRLPDGLLPGPRFGAAGIAPRDQGAAASLGVIVKPPLGLAAADVARAVGAAVAGGADLVKDDEILGDPPSCPLYERVAAVATVLDDGTIYCPNVTGPSATLLERARRVVELGATGVMLAPFAQGLDALIALRDADLGVPIYAHRAGSGPLARSARFGATSAVLAQLVRLCGADWVAAGGFGGSLFDGDDEVRASIDAIRGPCGRAPAAIPVVGGALTPDGVAEQARRAGGAPLLVMLGSGAYAHPGGLEAGVRAAAAALRAA
ncbi:MAG: RuBisCO large subunit C-terminal-like domain-containing protein [Solirubrobacteraceae bacterium]|nr:RuBisCO large subunit C-terminal-like domain-containing protein [Solirubrobacteraceae bacterium]